MKMEVQRRKGILIRRTREIWIKKKNNEQKEEGGGGGGQVWRTKRDQ